MKNIFEIRLSDNAVKDLQKTPIQINKKLMAWILAVSEFGLVEVSRAKGYHDEPLKGKRLGQRSIRLNRSYRAIYKILKDEIIEFIEIQEVNKHEY